MEQGTVLKHSWYYLYAQDISNLTTDGYQNSRRQHNQQNKELLEITLTIQAQFSKGLKNLALSPIVCSYSGFH